jgi:hypothetical protein
MQRLDIVADKAGAAVLDQMIGERVIGGAQFDESKARRQMAH